MKPKRISPGRDYGLRLTRQQRLSLSEVAFIGCRYPLKAWVWSLRL